MSSWVASYKDLITHGLPAAALVPDAREIGGVVGSTVEICGHGFDLTPVRFSARAGGTLDTALSPIIWYTAVSGGDPDFFSLLSGSAPIALAGDGTGTIMVLEDVRPKLAAMLLARTSYVVAHAKAYAGPWTTPPDWAPMIVAQLTAYDVASQFRIAPSRYDVDLVKTRYLAAEALCVRLDAGEPLGDGVGPVDADPAVANMGPRFRVLGTKGPLAGDVV